MSPTCPPAVRAARAFGAGAVVFATALAAILYTKDGAHIAPFWPTNALALALLLRADGPKHAEWMAFALAMAAANLASGLALAPAALFSLFNLVDVATSYLVIRRFARGRTGPAGTGALVMGAFAGPLVGASLSALVLAPLLGAPPWTMWMGWWLPSMLAVLVILPLGVLVSARDIQRLRGGTVEIAACVVAIALVAGVVVATHRIAFIFLAAPVIFYAAMRFRSLGSAAATALAAALFVPLASSGNGAPGWGGAGLVLLVQGFLSVNASAALVLSVLLDERDGLVGALRSSEAAARAQAEAKSRLLTHVSHEIRTPLNVIQGFSERLAQKTTLTDSQNTLVAGILEASSLLKALAVDLIDTARIEQGALGLAPAWFDPAPVLRSVADAAGADVDVEVDAGLRVWADPLRFRQIAQNLVSNAVRHGAAHGAIKVRLREAGAGVRLTVCDCGPGFPPGMSHRAFEPFALRSSGGTEAASTGVGLSLVRLLAEAHGGSAGLASTPHVETAVWVELPFEGAPAALRAAAGAKSAETDPDRIFADGPR